MKLFSLLIGLFFISIMNVNAQHQNNSEHEEEGESHHCLFKKNSIAVGLGAPYSFHVEGVGINARVYYNSGEHICFGPEFSFVKNGELSLYDFNFIGHFIFETKIVGIYPLAGVNYTIEEDPHGKEEAFGAVVGGGLHRNVDSFTFFAEYSHVISPLKDDLITVGALFNIR